MDELAAWPSYLHPYQAFRFSFLRAGSSELDQIYGERAEKEDRITLVADHDSLQAIAYVSLIGIDWEKRTTENIGIRLHPAHCGKGLGTRILQLVSDWWFKNGMATLQLDVAASNERAIRCYARVGFRVVDEFWREAPDLVSIDLSSDRFQFLRGHTRFLSKVPELRFLVMRQFRTTT